MQTFSRCTGYAQASKMSFVRTGTSNSVNGSPPKECSVSSDAPGVAGTLAGCTRCSSCVSVPSAPHGITERPKRRAKVIAIPIKMACTSLSGDTGAVTTQNISEQHILQASLRIRKNSDCWIHVQGQLDIHSLSRVCERFLPMHLKIIRRLVRAYALY